jgi:hypothetical protein
MLAADASSTGRARDNTTHSRVSSGSASGATHGAPADRPATPEVERPMSAEGEHWSPDHRVYMHQYSTWGTKPVKINF